MKKAIYLEPHIKCRAMEMELMAANSLPIKTQPGDQTVTEGQQLSKKNSNINLWEDTSDSSFE